MEEVICLPDTTRAEGSFGKNLADQIFLFLKKNLKESSASPFPFPCPINCCETPKHAVRVEITVRAEASN